MSDTRNPSPSPQYSQRYLPNKPSRVKFSRLVDGFKAVVPLGTYFSGGIFLGLSLLTGMLLAPALVFPLMWAGLVTSGVLAWRAANKLLGELSIQYRDGKLYIKEGILGMGKEVTIPVNNIRSVKRIMKKDWYNLGAKHEQLEIQTNNGEIHIGMYLSRKNRDFIYNTLIYYLERSLNRIP